MNPVESGRFAIGSFTRDGGDPFLGVVQDDTVLPVAALDPGRFGSAVTLRELLDNWAASLPALKAGLASADRAHAIPLEDLRAGAPIPDARQIFCTGANYGRHFVEMSLALDPPARPGDPDPQARRAAAEALLERQKRESQPFVFMKPVTAIAGAYDDLLLPAFSQKADWELELGAVIGRVAHRTPLNEAMACVAGYMIVNDVTARDKVKRTDPGALSLDWLAGKGAPGFLPTGPVFVPAEFVADPHDLSMRLSVNGETMQDDRSSDMTFDIAQQIAFITTYARMLPGDILCTGSPAGNGVIRGVFLKPGDVMQAEIEGLGRQVVRCVG